MNITYACPQCDATAQVEVVEGAEQIACPHCNRALAIPGDAFEEGRLRRCLVCPSTDLFIRKDFPQRLGVAIVVAGFAISCITWYYYLTYLTFGVLLATALIDVLLYVVMGEAVQCYRCKAHYRDVPHLEEHDSFNLETHERHRQQQARLAQRRPGPDVQQRDRVESSP